MSKSSNEWKQFKASWISVTPVLPGVWLRREGGHVVRGRVRDTTTGQVRELWKVLADADAATALKWLEDEKNKIRAGGIVETAAPQARFSEFAASLFEHKVKVGDIKSAAGRNKWADVLEHLIAGVTGESGARARARPPGVFGPGT